MPSIPEKKPQIKRQAENKRSPVRYMLPDYPASPDSRVILLCIPDHVNFTIAFQTALAHFEYQGNWEGAYDENRDRFRSDWARMVSTMECLDLSVIEAKIERIATALESIEDKTPNLVSLQDILSNPELYFAAEILATIAPLLDILRYVTSFFPEIKVDPFKVVQWVTAMIRHTQMIAALMSITAAIAALGAAQGLETLVGLISAGSNYLFKMQDAFTDMRDDLLGLLSKFFTEPIEEIDNEFAEADYSQHWIGQNSILAEMAAHMDKANALKREEVSCVCSNFGCCTCGAGVVIDAPEYDIGAGVPEGFLDCESWEDYKCNGANWLTDKLVQVATRIDEMPNALREFESRAKAGEVYSIGELNTVVGQFVFTTMDPLWLANMSAANLGPMTTAATQWASDWLSSVATDYPESTLQEIQDDWFTNPIASLISEAATDKNTTIQDLYANAETNTEVLDTLKGWWQTAIANAIGFQDAHTDFFGSIPTRSVATLLLIPVGAIEGYLAAVPCTGDTGCAGPPAGLGVCYQIQGTWDAPPDQWRSQYTTLSISQMYTDATKMLTNVSLNGGGPTDKPLSGQTMYRLTDKDGIVVYDSDTPPPSTSGEYRSILFRGETEFTVKIDFDCEDYA